MSVCGGRNRIAYLSGKRQAAGACYVYAGVPVFIYRSYADNRHTDSGYSGIAAAHSDRAGKKETYSGHSGDDGPSVFSGGSYKRRDSVQNVWRDSYGTGSRKRLWRTG